MLLYLIRHGVTEENKRHIIMGWLNAPLSKDGKEQALQFANKFDHKVDAIFSSDLKRCLETADPFRNKVTDAPFFMDWRLRERYLGDAQGKKRDEIFTEGSSDIAANNVETLDQYRIRVRGFLDSVKILEYRFDTLLVVTHNGTINRMIEIIHGAEDSYTSYGNGEVVELEI